MSNLMVAPAETKANFNEVKNYLMMYGAVEKLISRCETFRINDNKTLIAKVAIGGKSIKIFLAIDPLTLEGTKYKYKDYSAKKAYTDVPTLIKVRSARSMKYFKEIVDMMMARFGVEKSEEFESADYLNSLIPNGQAILGKLRLPAECLVESVDAKEIPADIPEGLIEQLHVLEAEALDEEKVEANVYLDTVANNFENGDLVNIDVLKSKHIVKQGNTIRVKARGTLNKQITIYAEEFDDDAVKMLLATNCTAIRIVRK